MNFENATQKQINSLEQETTQLLKVMRKSRLHLSPLYTELQDFERKLGEERRIRFDRDNSDYRGY